VFKGQEVSNLPSKCRKR